MKQEIEKIIRKMLEQESKVDSLEYGATGRRFKVYFDADDPGQMRRKIENQLGAIEYADLLTEEESDGGLLMEKFLKRRSEEIE